MPLTPPRHRALALLGLMLVVFAVLAWYVLGFQSYMIMPDELGYMKNAVGFAQLSPNSSGDFWFHNYSQFAQLLIAPAYALFSTPTAFDVSHLIQAAVMVSSAIPVYVLSRRVGASALVALIAAAAAIVVPWTAMSATLMTEPVAYAVFAWTMLAYHGALARPSTRADVIAIAATAIAFLTRTQFAALAAVFAIALVAYELLSAWYEPAVRRSRFAIEAARSLWLRHRIIVVAAGLALVLALLGPLGRSSLGAYGMTLSGDLLPAGMWPILHDLIAELVVAVGVLPAVGLVAFSVRGLGPRISGEERALACLAIAATTVLLLEIGSFAIRFSAGANDRYVAYLAPLCAVGFAAILRPGRRSPWPLVVSGAVLAWLVATSTFLNLGPSVVAVTSNYQDVLNGRAQQLGSHLGFSDLAPEHAMAALTVALVLAYVAARHFLRGTVATVATAILVLTVLGWCAAETSYSLNRLRNTQEAAPESFKAMRDWLDRSLPGDAKAGIVLSMVGDPGTTQGVYWDTSFWTTKGDRVFREDGQPIYEQEFATPFAIDRRSGRIPALDQRSWLVRAVSDRRFGLAGERMIASTGTMQLVRARMPYRASWSFHAQDDAGTVAPRKAVTMRIYPLRPGQSARSVRVTLATGAGAARAVGVHISGPGIDITRKIRNVASRRNTIAMDVSLPASGPAALTLRADKGAAGIQLVEVR